MSIAKQKNFLLLKCSGHQRSILTIKSRLRFHECREFYVTLIPNFYNDNCIVFN